MLLPVVEASKFVAFETLLVLVLDMRERCTFWRMAIVCGLAIVFDTAIAYRRLRLARSRAFRRWVRRVRRRSAVAFDSVVRI